MCLPAFDEIEKTHNVCFVLFLFYITCQPSRELLLLLLNTTNKVTQDKRERYKLQETTPTHFECGKDTVRCEEKKYVVNCGRLWFIGAEWEPEGGVYQHPVVYTVFVA